MENDEKPVSDSHRVVIPSNEQSYTFDKNCYKDAYLGHCIDRNEFDSIISNASKIMGNSWTKKRINDQIKLPRFVIILAITAVILTVIYMVLLYMSTYSDNGTTMMIVSIICVTAGSIIAFGLSIYNFCRKIGRFKTLEEIIKEDLEEYFEIINKKYIGDLHMIFNINKRWIECNILRPVEKSEISKEEKKSIISEGIAEEPENENDQELITKKPVFHSRNISSKSGNKVAPMHSKKPSVMTSPAPSRHSRQISQI